MMPPGSLPRKALSIRQPWAWAIIHGGKDVENRNWNMRRPENLKFRGNFCIHAAKGMTRHEYLSAADFMKNIDVKCPPADQLFRGGLIGTANLVDIVQDSQSPWFFGPKGLILQDRQPIEFIPSVGFLGFFVWQVASNEYPPKPANWMSGKPGKKVKSRDLIPDLFDNSNSTNHL